MVGPERTGRQHGGRQACTKGPRLQRKTWGEFIESPSAPEGRDNSAPVARSQATMELVLAPEFLLL